MRILIGAMGHESDSFNPILTGVDEFRVFIGNEMLTAGLQYNHSIKGIYSTLTEKGCEIVPTLIARAVPNGWVSASFYRDTKAKFIQLLKDGLAAGPIDGVCLALHGSMKIENFGPAEADLLKSIREFLPHVPIVCSLDMHGTITPELMRYGDAFVGYKTAPHIDTFETGAHAANMLLKSLGTGKKLVSAYRRIPMMLAGEKSETAAEPMVSLMEELRKTEKLPGIEAASYLIAHVWSDTEYNSMYSVVTSLDDRDAAEDAAVKLAAVFWARRKDFKFRNEHYDAAESLRVAYEAVFEKHQHPVFVSDSGDNPTAGATGDATELLERIMDTMDTVDKLPTPFLYSGFYDAPAVRACIAAGPGAKLDITVGGNWDTVNGKKIPLTVEVKKIVTAYGPGSADIALVSYRNLLISLTSKHIGFGDPNLLPALGVKAEEYCLVAVKLGYLEPCFREIAARAIMATTSGASNEVLENLPFKKVIRPIYPLDKDMEFTPV